ncbi:major facilitator superfamily domain-containing protein [Lipomyces arxii]|uniref:major facilitator superfamily domain-containing protein n=1 Tax=Lipomyces arxii TaxID=56418 RepID=UPI0034CDCFBB
MQSVQSDQVQDAPYSVYTGWSKTAIIIVSAISVFFSAFNVNVYLPELSEVARDLGVTTERINVTVTVYYIMQGFTPTLWSSLADSLGRRPVYLMTYTICLAANIAISVTESFGSLVVLRMLQATGSAASVSIGLGTVADIIDRDRRGTYLGIVSSMAMLAPAIAPVLSGVLSVSSYGWRTVFLFVLALGFVHWVVLVLWMPETARNIVGNGSIAPKRWYSKSVIALVTKKQWPENQAAYSTLAPPRPLQNPLRVLLIVAQKDVSCLLFATALWYCVYTGLTVGSSSLFPSVYDLSTLKVGLCFLPLGCGSILGSIFAGKVIDYDYKRLVKKLGYNSRDNDMFPLERARLNRLPYYFFPFFGPIIVFGWTMRSSISLAVPLVMMFISGFGFMTVYTTIQVLLTDLYPNQSVSVNAVNNLVRCWLGAGASALIEVVDSNIGTPWTYTTLAFICFTTIPLVLTDLIWGPKWRRARNERQRKAEEQRVADLEHEMHEMDDQAPITVIDTREKTDKTEK